MYYLSMLVLDFCWRFNLHLTWNVNLARMSLWYVDWIFILFGLCIGSSGLLGYVDWMSLWYVDWISIWVCLIFIGWGIIELHHKKRMTWISSHDMHNTCQHVLYCLHDMPALSVNWLYMHLEHVELRVN